MSGGLWSAPTEIGTLNGVAHQSGAGAKRGKLSSSNVAWQRGQATIGTGLYPLGIRMFQGFAQGCSHRFGQLDCFCGDVDAADQDLFVAQMPDQRDRHLRTLAFEGYLLDTAFVQRRKNLVVLPPFVAERLFPLIVGLAAVTGGLTR